MLLFFLINNALWLFIAYLAFKTSYLQRHFTTKFAFTTYASVVAANLLYVLRPPVDGYGVFIITTLNILFSLYALLNFFCVAMLQPEHYALKINKRVLAFDRYYDVVLSTFLTLYTATSFYHLNLPVINSLFRFDPILIVAIFALIKCVIDYSYGNKPDMRD